MGNRLPDKKTSAVDSTALIWINVHATGWFATDCCFLMHDLAPVNFWNVWFWH
jgi:hypothetical protein